MTKWFTAIIFSALTASAMAETTNGFERGSFGGGEHRRGEGMLRERFKQLSPEQKTQIKERRLQLLEKTLEEIGVTQEQREKISEIQKLHKEAMNASMRAISEARKNLSELEKSDAPQAEIFAAIDIVSAAQSEQMKILARNRMEMEAILGKEKYKQFMDAARNQYRKHDRRGGSGMPPRPGLPPVPGAELNKQPKTPPTP